MVFLTCDFDSTDSNDNDSEFEPEWIEGDSNTDTTIYYVSTKGSDRASGTHPDQAFRSISKAFKSVKPSGKIYILPGTYSESLGPLRLGNAKDSVLIAGFQVIPVLDGNQTL